MNSSEESSNSSVSTPSTSIPLSSSVSQDESAKKRFANLAIIGDFLFQISNDNAEQTEYFLAKTALQEFEAAVKLVDLDLKIRSGVENLIKYLNKKIEKRNRQAGGEFSKD